MNELTKQQYIDVFGTSDDQALRLAIDMWNHIHPEDQVATVERRATKTIMVYREELPAELELILATNEANGKQYTDFGVAALRDCA